MIEAERETLSQTPAQAARKRRRGAPLAMLLTVAAVWIAGRAVLWENPYRVDDLLGQASTLLADRGEDFPSTAQSAALDQASIIAGEAREVTGIAQAFRATDPRFPNLGQYRAQGLASSTSYRPMGREHYALWRAALTSDPRGASWTSASRFDRPAATGDALSSASAPPPFLPAPSKKGRLDRWSLDAWAFWREGSDAAPVSQGRVPVYGASQAGALLQYRFDPGSARDARAYVRAYRALVDRPESEVALGVSARPKPSVPVRLAAELRVTDNRFDTRVRPAAYAVTEIPPVELPFDLRADIYAGAGYVAGEGDTLFADGQANVTRQLARFGSEGRDAVKLSVGAGAWGGAQRDANRLDVGPTMRVDLSVGDVPARFSIDWRERVGGDASPVSGLAATLSTSF